ncbi:hypothetical protein RZS08_39245, partial [Arthrospira platensis SPKY1]|nr:hypothetical protein [Arthrospira platensis SPKY1]
VIVEPQLYIGAGDATPIVVNLDVIFSPADDMSVVAMFYTEYTNSFTTQDLSVLSNHLMGPEKRIVKLAYQNSPAKTVWALRSDGVLLALTYERAQEVFAWSRHVTQGKVVDMELIKEFGQERLHLLVERNIAGRWVICHERMPLRVDNYPDDFFGVDCGYRRRGNIGTT